MDADKAPGPDGLNPDFYQHFWSLLGDDVFVAVHGWLEDGVLPQELHKTNTVLLPNVDNVRSMKDNRYRCVICCTGWWPRYWQIECGG
ncbi:hypothetical protein LINGRAHAP2_LOCUS11509 [Linum grandiflorum]